MTVQGSIVIVGLGSGDENQLSLGVWHKLQQAQHLYLRTADHPVVHYLQQHHIGFKTFDALYEAHHSFPEVYEAIVNELIDLALTHKGEIVYAVPGHPMMGETTVQQLKIRCAQHIELTILGGESFLDQAFIRLGFDPFDGFQLLDGTQLDPAMIQPQLHTVITQVYDEFTASDVKLSLMSIYPDDFQVVVGHALGIPSLERIQHIPLYELDRIADYGNHSMIWIPRTTDAAVINKQFSRLQDIISILRSPEGCPWDREQTHLSIRRHLIEETYEVLETIDDDDPEAMCEELGDLLMQIMLHAQIEAEQGSFNILDVIAELNAKLVRRHPHVFGEQHAGNAEEALTTWQAIKAEEKRHKGQSHEADSILSGIPRDLPSAMKALDLQKRAAKVGFDWSCIDDVLAKLREEIEELEEVVRPTEHTARQIEELGDVFFSVVNVARFLNIDPEAALEQANRKFITRFSYIEEKLRLKGSTFEQTDIQEMEKWWQEAKQR